LTLPPAQEWDLIVSCYEPLGRVTGGIGTYTRLLLHRLAAIHGSILAFTASEEQVALPENVTLITVPDVPSLGRRPLNNLPDQHFAYSFHLAAQLARLEEQGHRFLRTEFPDYGNDGYFALGARKAGMLDLGHVSVRLHSPSLMLRDDNRWPKFLAPLDLVSHGAAERFVLEETDSILYGDRPMLDRVLDYFDAEERARLQAKALHVPHPWPVVPPETRPKTGAVAARSATASPEPDAASRLIRIGLVGRLEVRKGSYEMLRLWEDARAFNPQPDLHVQYHFIGGTTADWMGRSVEEVLRRHVEENDLSGKVVFHGRVSQEALPALLGELDGLMYPSRFENYPNALIEAMQMGKAVLVSRHGCMPNLSAGYPDARVTDPCDPLTFADNVAAFAVDLAQGQANRAASEAARRAAYARLAAGFNEEHDRAYANAPAGEVAEPAAADISIAFVIPHFRQASFVAELFDDLSRCLQPGDEVLVVDDASGPEHLARLEEAIGTCGLPIRLLAKSVNEGPGSARDDGIAASSAAAIQFCDADDRLDPRGIAAARRALARHSDLDAVVGVQECFGDLDHFWVPMLPAPELAFVRNFSHSAVLFRREIFARTEGYPRRRMAHFEDWLFDLRFMLEGGKLLVLPLVTLFYRIRHGESRSHFNAVDEYHSWQTMLEDALDFARRRGRVLDESAILRLFGQAWLLERSTLAPGQIGLRPRRYDVADRIVQSLHGRPRLMRLAIAAANRLLRLPAR